MTGLEAVLQLIIIAFVFFSILYAENKFLSVQNIGLLKESKRLSLTAEALQTVPSDSFDISYHKLNSSIILKGGAIEIKSDSGKIDEDFSMFNPYFTYSCTLELLKKQDASGKTSYVQPNPVFKMSGNDVTCTDNKEVSNT